MPTDNIEQVLAGPVADIIKQTWIFLAQPHSATGDYVRGLMMPESMEYPYGGDPLSVSVVNVSRHAMVVEVGHEGFHLPDRVRYWKHRVLPPRGGQMEMFAKAGRRSRVGMGYFVVPFRHFAPGTLSSSGRAIRAAMPTEIYERAKNLGRERLRGLGDLYKQSKSYVYYRATQRNFPQHLRGRGYTWHSSKYEGMVRGAQITPHANQGVYTTFRTVTEDSQGWWIPPMAGLHLARQAAERAGPMIGPIIAEAAQRDLVEGITTVLAGAGFQVRVN